jgi:hypothetical protein
VATLKLDKRLREGKNLLAHRQGTVQNEGNPEIGQALTRGKEILSALTRSIPRAFLCTPASE